MPPEVLTFPIFPPADEKKAEAAHPTVDAALQHLEKACDSVCRESDRAREQARGMKRRISNSEMSAVKPPAPRTSTLDLEDLLDTGVTNIPSNGERK